MAILGPKIYRFGLRDPAFVSGNDIEIGFAVFTVIPMWGSIFLGRVNLAYSRTAAKIPKFSGAASKHYRYM